MATLDTAVAYSEKGVFRTSIVIKNATVHSVNNHKILSVEDSIALSHQILSTVVSQAVSNPDGIGAKLVNDLSSIETKVDTIDTVVDSIQADTTAIQVETDKIPTLLTGQDDIDTQLDTIEGKVDTIDTAVFSTLGNTVAIENKVDIIDTVVDSTKIDTTTLLTGQDDIDTQLATINNKLPTGVMISSDKSKYTKDLTKKIKEMLKDFKGDLKDELDKIISKINTDKLSKKDLEYMKNDLLLKLEDVKPIQNIVVENIENKISEQNVIISELESQLKPYKDKELIELTEAARQELTRLVEEKTKKELIRLLLLKNLENENS